jgi:hypothetical protein
MPERPEVGWTSTAILLQKEGFLMFAKRIMGNTINPSRYFGQVALHFLSGQKFFMK